MSYYITLGDGTRVGMGDYVNAVKTVKRQPLNAWYPRTFSGWGGTGHEVLAQFVVGVHDRINKHMIGYGVGRKWDERYHVECLRIQERLNSRLFTRQRDLRAVHTTLKQLPIRVQSKLVNRAHEDWK